MAWSASIIWAKTMSDVVIIAPDPVTRINDRWLLRNHELQQIVAAVPDNVSYKNFVDTFSHDMETQHAELGQQAFLHVIAETVYHYPVTYLSEKPIKPIVCKRPFVIVGPVGSLESLRSMGFRTFHAFWDESYDVIADPEERLLAVVDIVEWISAKSLVQVQSLCTSMTDVLNYNFEFYRKHFHNRESERLEAKCMANLKPRYDTNQNPNS
jgi:hypothetical protein